jgi:hypothetical protein
MPTSSLALSSRTVVSFNVIAQFEFSSSAIKFGTISSTLSAWSRCLSRLGSD